MRRVQNGCGRKVGEVEIPQMGPPWLLPGTIIYEKPFTITQYNRLHLKTSFADSPLCGSSTLFDQ